MRFIKIKNNGYFDSTEVKIFSFAEIKILILSILILMSLSTKANADESYFSEYEFLEQDGVTNIYYINYKRDGYNVKNDYKTYSSDLSEDYKLQRKKEESLVRR